MKMKYLIIASTLTSIVVVFALSTIAKIKYPTITDKFAKILKEDSEVLLKSLNNTATTHLLHESYWPKSFFFLRPISVKIKSDGIYLCTFQMFVREWGIFILNPCIDGVQNYGDPEYQYLFPKIYYYNIKG